MGTSVSSASEQPQQPDPQPRSRSVSVEEAPAPASRKKSVASSIAENDTDDEVEDIGEAALAPVASAPVPVERKVSAPTNPEIVIDEAAELTKDEVELSKRETVHLDEAEKAEVIAEVTSSRSADSESADSDSEDVPVQAAVEAPVEAKPATIIETSVKNGDDSDSSENSSSEDEMNNIKPSHNNRFANSPTTEDHHELNGRKSNNGIDVTKIYKNAVENNNNNIEKQGDQGTPTRTKPAKDITQIYTQKIAAASPPASPRSIPRGRPD